MKILVAGATGTLGVPLVRSLLDGGHEVTGLCRSERGRTLLGGLGAKAAVADALDPEALQREVVQARPEVLIDLLTAIPAGGALRASDLDATNELRTRGTSNLLAAAEAAGVRRVVGESVVFAYGFGDLGEIPLEESHPPAPPAKDPALLRISGAARSLEDQILEASRRGAVEGIVLRYGLIYGFASPSTAHMIRLLAGRKLPVIPGARGVGSWIHLDDAVTATLAAMERGRSGEIYNVVDDEPAPLDAVIRLAAEATGARRPISVPYFLIRLTMPFVAAGAATRLPVSNRKAREELGWRPRYPSYREGWRQIAEESRRGGRP